MRESTGLICNWRKPCQAIGELLVILAVILCLFDCTCACLCGIQWHIPLHLLWVFLVGEILRAGPPCSEVVKN